MRLLATTLASLLSLAAFSQTLYEKVEVVELETPTPAPALMQNAKRWFVDTFKDAKEVIQLEDAATNTIVGKGSFKYKPTINNSSQGRVGSMQFSVEVGCKDGRYRVRFYDFTHVAISGLGPIKADTLTCGDGVSYRYVNGKPTKFLGRVCVEEVWPQIHATEAQLLESLSLAMKSKAVSTDW